MRHCSEYIYKISLEYLSTFHGTLHFEDFLAGLFPEGGEYVVVIDHHGDQAECPRRPLLSKPLDGRQHHVSERIRRQVELSWIR